MNEQKRLEVIQRVMDDRFTIKGAGKVLDLSERQMYRVVKKVREEGVTGVIHKNKGKKSPRKFSEGNRQKILDLVEKRLSDINDTHLCEILEREEKIVIGRETLRKILRHAGKAPKRRRRAKKHRTRRERKAALGEMLQMDASDHDWLEGRGPRFALILAIDDATNLRWANFEDAETTWAYLDLLHHITTTKGLPLSVYNDRHTIFTSPKKQTIDDELKNKRPLTQLGRAIDELGIRMILAYSPQAKGRVERQFDTFQDRLVAELRLAGAKTKEAANDVLKKVLIDFNKRFSVTPKKRESVFRQSPSPALLRRILCVKEFRTVKNDNTVSFNSLILQIPKTKKYRSFAGRKVEVLHLRDGSIEIEFKKNRIAHFNPDEVAVIIKKRKFKCLDDNLKLAIGY